MPARIEMRRLTAIGNAAVERVVRTNRNIDFLIGVPVEVAEVERVGSVGVLFPAVVGRTDVLPTVVGSRSLGVQSRTRRVRAAQEKRGAAYRREYTRPHGASPSHRVLVRVWSGGVSAR